MFDPATVIEWLGPHLLAGAWLISFFESVALGVVLPGDGLLFTIGLFAAAVVVHVELWLLCLLVAIAAILGNICGYRVGANLGPALFTRPDSKLFKS